MTDPSRVLLVGDARSIHTARWANALADHGVDVLVAGLTDAGDQPYHPSVRTVALLPGGAPAGLAGAVRAVPALVRTIAAHRPQLVNSHYASAPALLANLAVAGRLPHLVSVWGRDVYTIPHASRQSRALVTGNLRLATAVGSTSRAMAGEVHRLAPGAEVHVTPFGIDVDAFTPREHPARASGPVRVGTIKAMTPTYGIDVLLRAFALVHAQHPDTVLDLYGDGPETASLQALAVELGIDEVTTFHGAIPHAQVPAAMRSLDVYVALSRAESFGVAILEACASAVPVVVSDAPGPAEVTPDGEVGLVVPTEDPEAAARAIGRLVADPTLRATMGAAGREHVLRHYTWEHSVQAMLDAYRATIARHRARPARVAGRLRGLLVRR